MSQELLVPSRAALVLVDYQKGMLQAVRSIPVPEMKHNAFMLAKAAKILDLPTILTTSMEEGAQGPLLEELVEALPGPYYARIQRHGAVNAMDDERFVAAVLETRRPQIILAGVTNGVATVLPAISLRRRNLSVFVAADAGGSPTMRGDELAMRRLDHAGVVVAGAGQLVAELARDWATPEGRELLKLLMS